mgnify:CR=1 FL=1
MNANPVFSLHIPTRILFGCGEIKKLATETLSRKKGDDYYFRWNFNEKIRIFR